MAETLLYQGVASNPVNGLRVRLGYLYEELSGTKSLTPQDAQFLLLDPAGAPRQVNLPQEGASSGLFFRIENLSDDADDLNIHDSAGDALDPAVSIGAGQAAFMVCNGESWALCQ
jgi:hypothetical protein